MPLVEHREEKRMKMNSSGDSVESAKKEIMRAV